MVLRLTTCLFALSAAGCLVGDFVPGSEPENEVDPADEEPTPEPIGQILEPAHGAVIAGDPAVLSFRVAGTSPTRSPLSVQVLIDPDDLSSWTTIAQPIADQAIEGGYQFSTDVRPVSREAELARWPAGGILRLRVVDGSGRALPYDAAQPDRNVLAVVNPTGAPSGWTFLTEKPVGSRAETRAYYATIDAPPTLDAFMARYGFPGDELSAAYYNVGDLAIGRDMHCRATQDPAGGVACYSRNFGTFGGNADVDLALAVAGAIPLATVCMVYAPPINAPNSVAFVAYDAAGDLLEEAQLDTRGDNTSIPQNCLNCHGGNATYDAVAHTVTDARFLPLDPAAFKYAQLAGKTFAAQEARFRGINRLIARTAPTRATLELVDGMFPPGDAPYDAAFVPSGWSANAGDREVYRGVVAPFCRGCHVSFALGNEDTLTFATADSLRGRRDEVLEHTCGTDPRGMPTAEQTALHFFSSSARALLLTWLGAPGACPPLALPTPPIP